MMSPLRYHNLLNPVSVFIAAGTLDDPSWAVPTSHIRVKRAMSTAPVHEDALVIEGAPVDRAVLMDAFARIYPLD